MSNGQKFDDDKPRMDLLPPQVLQDVAQIFTFGAEKYGDHNWRDGINYSRIYAACMRHLTAFWDGETFDPESDMHHLDHAIANLMMLSHYEGYQYVYGGFDDRCKEVDPEWMLEDEIDDDDGDPNDPDNMDINTAFTEPN